jgi:CRP-like cAMP-binding protein
MQASTLEEMLSSHPFVAGLDGKFLNLLASCASLRRFSSRQHIFEEGGEADHFYLILVGKVILETVVPNRGTLSIQTLGAGDALGWSWLFAPYRWRFTAVTSAPTEVISFGAGFLRERASNDVEFANELLRRIAQTLVQRLAASQNKLNELCSGERSLF